ncbi:hypothetical protein DESC_500002 [Desulfosarcina cetonica]|nr:hypothetical protein DESC_500002 [Desulfosarcina cetonica]
MRAARRKGVNKCGIKGDQMNSRTFGNDINAEVAKADMRAPDNRIGSHKPYEVPRQACRELIEGPVPGFRDQADGDDGQGGRH